MKSMMFMDEVMKDVIGFMLYSFCCCVWFEVIVCFCVCDSCCRCREL